MYATYILFISVFDKISNLDTANCRLLRYNEFELNFTYYVNCKYEIEFIDNVNLRYKWP